MQGVVPLSMTYVMSCNYTFMGKYIYIYIRRLSPMPPAPLLQDCSIEGLEDWGIGRWGHTKYIYIYVQLPDGQPGHRAWAQQENRL